MGAIMGLYIDPVECEDVYIGNNWNHKTYSIILFFSSSIAILISCDVISSSTEWDKRQEGGKKGGFPRRQQ